MSKLTRTEYNFITLLRAALADRVIEAGEVASAFDSPECVAPAVDRPEFDVPAGEIDVVDASGFDARAVLRLAYNHKLWHMILSAMPRGLIPGGIDRRSELFRRVAAQVTVTSAFIELWSAMADAGFHPIVVKGIICRTLYPRPELRPSSDEDLYIPAAEFEDCCLFLQSRGIVPDKTPFSDYGEVGFRGEGGIFIELHRDLFEGDSFDTLGDFFSFDSIEPEFYPTHYGVPVTSMSPHDHFLYLLLHAYKHFVHSGFGIRQVCDIGIWAREYGERIDWSLLSEQCDRAGIRKFVTAVLGIARHVLDISFECSEDFACDAEYCAPMLKDILCGGIYGSADADRVHSSTMTLNAVNTSGSKGKPSVLRSVFPSRRSLEGRYTYLKKYPILLPAAWCARIFSYAKRSSAGETSASKSIAIGKERIELLRYYGLVE